MALPDVYIELVRNGLGLVSKTTDNVCGMVLTGEAVAGKLVLGTPYSIFSTADANDLGIAATGVNAAAFRHISEFYSVAGIGKKLWIIVAANTVTLSEMADITQTPCVAKTLLDRASGEISLLGLAWTPAATGYVPVILDSIDTKVHTAKTKAQELAVTYAGKIMPFVAVIEGRSYSGAKDTLRDLGTETNFRTAVTLCSTKTDGSASVGLVLGQLAASPVQRKISRVKNGALPITAGYLSSGATIESSESSLSTINDKRYIIFRKFPNKSGYFFNGDMTATAVTDDLNMIARVRTIDKAMKIAYNTYVEELDDDVEVNDDGTLSASVAAYLKQKIEAQVNGNMTGEISKFTATVDTTIDILAGNEQKIYMDIVPRGYLNPIRVVLGFKNS